MNLLQLTDKVTIITGAGSGIGEATARLFAEQGARVIVCDQNLNEAKRVSSSLKGKGFAVRADVSNEDEVKHLIQKTLDYFGQIDILVNNAAKILPKRIEDTSIEEWDRLFAVNLRSIFLTVKYAIHELRKTKGNIVNMSSLNGLIGQRGNPTYAASKGGVVSLTKALALDFATDGVRVNCICPAGVMTPLLSRWIGEQIEPQETLYSLERMHPLGRVATAEEIAQAILYLSSPQSSFVTGVALPVEGGASLGY